MTPRSTPTKDFPSESSRASDGRALASRETGGQYRDSMQSAMTRYSIAIEAVQAWQMALESDQVDESILSTMRRSLAAIIPVDHSTTEPDDGNGVPTATSQPVPNEFRQLQFELLSAIRAAEQTARRLLTRMIAEMDELRTNQMMRAAYTAADRTALNP